MRGPLARTPEDLALLLSATAGADVANVGMGWKLDMPKPTKSALAGYCVAIWATDPACPTTQEIQAACSAVGAAMAERGATVDYEARPDFSPAESFAVSQVRAACKLFCACGLPISHLVPNARINFAETDGVIF